MKVVIPHPSQRWMSLGLFVIGLVGTLVALQIPAAREALEDLERSGYFGALVAGVMYGIGLTSVAATVIFANLPDSLNPILAALCGALGATLYDVGIFSLTRQPSIHDRMVAWTESITHHHRLPRNVSLVIGGLLIASPIPDEFAATFLGFSAIPMRTFVALSFGFNFLGILIINELF